MKLFKLPRTRRGACGVVGRDAKRLRAACPSGPATVAAAVLAMGKGLMQQDHLRRPPNSRTGQVPASVRPPAPRRPQLRRGAGERGLSGKRPRRRQTRAMANVVLKTSAIAYRSAGPRVQGRGGRRAGASRWPAALGLWRMPSLPVTAGVGRAS